jgi:hypothetical protein
MAGEFDTLALRRRVEEWRAEAERVPDRHMRVRTALPDSLRYTHHP